MAKVSFVREEPVEPPPAKVILELTVDEALALKHKLGYLIPNTLNDIGATLYNALAGTLRQNGVPVKY